MLKTSRFRPNPTWCILRRGLKTIWGNFQTAASDSYFWKKRNEWVSNKTTTTNLNRNRMAYPTLFHASVQLESLLHNLELAARGIILYKNSDKTEFMCYDMCGAISSSSHWNLSTKSLISVAISHLLKVMSTYTKVKHQLLLTGYRLRENLISRIK